MTAAIPPYGAPAPTRIEFRRGSWKALVLGMALTGFFTVVSIMGAIWPEKLWLGEYLRAWHRTPGR